MEWFHCNRCFRRKGGNFVVSSCGHICCGGCVDCSTRGLSAGAVLTDQRPDLKAQNDSSGGKQCSVCGAQCNYLPITNEMKPQEKVFFRDPVKLIQSQLEHIAQVALFQRKQKQRATAYYKHRSAELEQRLKEVTEQGYRQVSELKRENAELKKPLSQRRVSPGQFPTSGAHRMSLPVAVTSPVTPRSQSISHPGSDESQWRARERGPGLSLTTPPGSAISISSRSSHQEHGFRTPTSYSTPTRTGHQNPNMFQFFNGSTRQSPRPNRNGH